MKLPYLLPLLAVAAAHAEEKTDLATADAYRPQYDFSPPPVITPQTPFGQPLENQFDYQRPWVNHPPRKTSAPTPPARYK